MGNIPFDVEEQAIQEEQLPSAPEAARVQEHHYRSAKMESRIGIVLGVIALGVSLTLGFWLIRSVRRLDRRTARLSHRANRLRPQKRPIRISPVHSLLGRLVYR